MTDDWITAGEQLSFYRQMIDSVTDCAVVRLDEKGVIRSWHTGAQRLTQHTAEEIIGQPLAILYPDGDGAGEPAADLAKAAEAGQRTTEGWRIRKDGARFWASVVLTPIVGEDGSVEGYTMVARDLTFRREQELALRGIEQMVDSITDYEVIRLDADGVIRSWNPGAQRLRQYTADEMIGQHLEMFYSEEDREARLPARDLAEAARDGRVEREGWRVRKDGSQFWANYVLSPIRGPEGDLVGFVKIARDQSERREQEQLLARQRDEILELSTPVIQVWDQVLVLPIIGTLDSSRAAQLTESLLERIAHNQAEVVILDVSGVPAIDTDVAQHLLKTVEAARLMGALSILSGVRPETAQAIVHLGIELGTLRSRSNLKDALQLALRMVGALASNGHANAGAAIHA